MLAVLTEIFAENFPLILPRLKDHARVREDLGMDSMDLMHLMVAIEDRYDFRFDPEEHDIESVFVDVASIELFLMSRHPQESQTRVSAGL